MSALPALAVHTADPYGHSDAALPHVARAVGAALDALSRGTSLARLIHAVQAGDQLGAELAIPWATLGPALRAMVARDLVPVYRQGAVAATRTPRRVRKAGQPAGLTLTFDLTNPRAVEWAQRYSYDLIREISEETRAAVRTITSRAFTEGLAPRQAARLIREVVGLTTRQALSVDGYRRGLEAQGVSPERVETLTARQATAARNQRAVTIARTETIRASSEGQDEVWRQAVDAGDLQPEATWQVWSTSKDSRTCPICGPMQGQKRRLGEPFETGDGRRVQAPPVHVQCRCGKVLEVDAPPPSRPRAVPTPRPPSALTPSPPPVALSPEDQAAEPPDWLTPIRTLIDGGLPTEADVGRLGTRVADEIQARLGEAWNPASGLAYYGSVQARAYADALRTVLGEIRPLGGVPLDLLPTTSVTTALEAHLGGTLRRVSDQLPRDWLIASNARGSIEVGVSPIPGGAYYSDRGGQGGRSRIVLYAAQDEASVALHELGHRVEYSVPGVLAYEADFYARRTAGETLTRLPDRRVGEVFRPDRFQSDYMGKWYSGQAYELLSMGHEVLFYGKYGGPRADPDFTRFILGLLAGV